MKWFLISLLPSYWMQLNRYNSTWDKKLNELIDAGVPFKRASPFLATIGGFDVWIANHPYASFTIGLLGDDVRPSRATMAKAMNWLSVCMINSK